jgi:signal transduction histidine kinase
MTTWLRSVSTRARLTLGFAAVMTLLLTGIAASIYSAMSTALLDEIDSGLRFRAAATASSSPGAAVETVNPALEERGEAFDQLLTSDGRVLRSSPGLPTTSLLSSAELHGVRGPTFLERRVPGVVGPARLLALALPGSPRGEVLVVGTTLADRTDALRHLRLILFIAQPIAVVVASLAGWLVAGLALRPVERMRRQADAITASGLDRRLDLPLARDGIRSLATTLNDLLGRLDTATRRDRLFLERASHELRTPLTALKAELEVASSGPRTVAAMSQALDGAREETDRLVRLANDLLVLARTRGGRLPLRREHVDLRQLLVTAAAGHQARAANHGIEIAVSCASETSVHLDPMRARQSIDNLLDNSLRHASAGQTISLTGSLVDDTCTVSVVDNGAGFADVPALEEQLSATAADELGPGGLGLRIARAVAVSHGGDLLLRNRPEGGAMVSLTFERAGSEARGAD